MIDTLFYLHGSPGHPDEAKPLKELGLPLVTPNRVSEELHIDKPCVLIGYSWGAREALELAAQGNPAIKGLVLIAPYVAPRKLGSAVKLILSTKMISQILLNKKAEGIVADLMEKTSYPLSPTPEFVTFSHRLKSPDVLRHAALEKRPFSEDVREELKNIRVPTLVIYGTADQTSSYTEQIEPVLNSLSHSESLVIENAGHALLFTHRERVLDAIKLFLTTLKTKELL